LAKPKEEISVQRLLAGDRGLWEAFVKRVSPVVFSVIRNTLLSAGHDVEDAYDIMQELFVKICRDDFRLLRRYNPEKSRITTWLAFIARNLAVDHLRRSMPQALSFEEAHAELTDKGDIPIETASISFENLPPRQMLVMKLLYERDMDVREVAAFMGISEQSVRSARHKAIGKLRHELC